MQWREAILICGVASAIAVDRILSISQLEFEGDRTGA
jgi:hypothetical protein